MNFVTVSCSLVNICLKVGKIPFINKCLQMADDSKLRSNVLVHTTFSPKNALLCVELSSYSDKLVINGQMEG